MIRNSVHGCVVVFLLVSGLNFSQITENDPNLKITEMKELYVNSVKELQSIEVFKDIQLKASTSEIQPTDPNVARMKIASLSVEKGGESVFCLVDSNFYGLNGLSLWNTLQIFPSDPNSSVLLCNYLIPRSGKIGAVTLSQQEPTGVAGVLRKDDKRWHLFQYTAKPEEVKRLYYDIYFDIDFDGYLDVRSVVDTKLKKITRMYIMYDMEWIKVDYADVYKEIPDAGKMDSGNNVKYEYIEGIWKMRQNRTQLSVN